MDEPNRTRVLVVDDDDASRAILALSLRRAGYDVESAGSGGQALALLAGGIFDWLITDCRMRPMNGFELAATAQRTHPRLRIVMISALSCEGASLGVRLEEYLCKPVPIERLLDVLATPPTGASTP